MTRSPLPFDRPTDQPIVVGIGEALFDCFASRPRLGGAPLNVATHAHRLLKPHGGEGIIVSCVGLDDLATQLKNAVWQNEMSLDYLQVDIDQRTGQVDVIQDETGHTFKIDTNSAWDHLVYTEADAELARRATAVAFGSLAQRHEDSRTAIQQFLDDTAQAIRLFDVNLRYDEAQPLFTDQILIDSCKRASIVKLNDEELETVCQALKVSSKIEMVERYELDAVILTRGAEGTAALTHAGFIEGEPASYMPASHAPADSADTVGAGDACSAGMLSYMMVHKQTVPTVDTLTYANRVAAYVAGQPGATPTLPNELML